MKNVKMIFFDVDGTLVPLDKDDISEKSVFALNKLKENGIKICVATGRAPIQLPKFRGINFDVYLNFNGSLVFNEKEDIFKNPLSKKDIFTLLENGKSMDKPLAVASKEIYACNGTNPDLKEYFSFGGSQPEIYKNFEEFIENEEIYQAILPIKENEYEKAMDNVLTTKIAAWWDRAVDLIPKNGGKGRAIEEVLSFFNIKKDECMAFGDGNNDLEMFEAVKYGICMENGSDDLKNISYDVCKSVDEDGIYSYLKEKGLI